MISDNLLLETRKKTDLAKPSDLTSLSGATVPKKQTPRTKNQRTPWTPHIHGIASKPLSTGSLLQRGTRQAAGPSFCRGTRRKKIACRTRSDYAPLSENEDVQRSIDVGYRQPDGATFNRSKIAKSAGIN
jgi:hypothetical protein